MQKTIHQFFSRGWVALLLAVLLNVNLLSLPAPAHAQGVQIRVSAQVARTAQIRTSTQVAQAAVQRGSLYGMGKVIIISLSQQHLYAYEDGQEVFDTPVLTGRPALPTPRGTFTIFRKVSPITFHSPFSRRSPYWYPPTHINYALQFKSGGYFLHDSWWHTVYGAGTNGRHRDPKYGWQDGSHGCVSMPLDAAKWIYNWAPIGTTVRIVR